MTDRVAVAIVRGAQPSVFIAEDRETLQWVLALKLIASRPGNRLEPELRDSLRSALRDERWADAVLAWMRANDLEIDIHESETLYQASDVELGAVELQFRPLFED